MRILAIETATEACSVALFTDDRLVDARHEVLGRGHAERLVPLIADLPGKGRADEIRVSLGPGSFTGTRIGIAAARALGLAWGATVLGYPTLALVAAMGRAEAGGGAVDTVMTGGHGEVFVQAFGADGAALSAHASLPMEDAARRLSAAIVAGNRAQELVALSGRGRPIPVSPDARQALLLPGDALMAALAPLYGRPPDAKRPG